MTPSDIARWRLATLGPAAEHPSAETALNDLLATQAQDFLPGCWSLAQRASSASRAAVESAYDEGRLLRTHVLRPTWHFVNPDDLRPLRAATAPRVHRINGSMYRREGIDDATMDTARKVLERALSTQHLTRNQLATADLGDQVTVFDVDGRSYLYLSTGEPPSQRETRVDLLQCYAELAMSYSESRDVLSGVNPYLSIAATSRPSATPYCGTGYLSASGATRGTPRESPSGVETQLHGEVDHDLLDAEINRFLDLYWWTQQTRAIPRQLAG